MAVTANQYKGMLWSITDTGARKANEARGGTASACLAVQTDKITSTDGTTATVNPFGRDNYFGTRAPT